MEHIIPFDLNSDEWHRNNIRLVSEDTVLGYGNPESKLCQGEQAYLFWKMHKSGMITDREDFLNKMLLYSDLEQACSGFGVPFPANIFEA